MSTVVRGAVSGLLATIPMSLIVAAGTALGLVKNPPPKQITANAERRSGVHPAWMPDELFHLSWLVAHLGYGAGAGVVYSLLRPLLPGGVAVRGLVYGLGLWAGSYIGLMPALGLYPSPKDDSSSRIGVMIAAHWVYGTVVARCDESL